MKPLRDSDHRMIAIPNHGLGGAGSTNLFFSGDPSECAHVSLNRAHSEVA
jgi:hypothetical protein